MTQKSVINRPTTGFTGPGTPASARDLVVAAARCIAEAGEAQTPSECYAAAHLAALRTAAAVLACRSRPTRQGRPRSAWELLAAVAPEYGEWAAFFAAGAAKRSAAEAGLNVVTAREADDLLRDARTFLDLVCEHLGAARQQEVPGLRRVS